MSRAFDPNQTAIIDALYDSAIIGHSRNGNVDHIAAALEVADAIVDLEAGGQTWAATYDDARRLDGYVKEVKRRSKRKVVSIPAPKIGDTKVPMAYSRRTKDGGHQLSLWPYVSLPELEALIRDMRGQAKTLTSRALAMRYGLDLARKHKVATAAEGFKAEGIDINELAA